MNTTTSNPSSNRYLSGNYAPVRRELNVSRLTVMGRLPSDLFGTYYCIGSNPQFDPVGNYHWFTGDGMVHAITLDEQGASYANRWVRTEKFNAERELGQPIFDGMNRQINTDDKYKQLNANAANTNIIMHAGKLQALNEGGLPVLMNAKDLSTIGTCNFGHENLATLTAHPRFEQSTGLLHTYSYLSFSGHLNYYCLNQQGQIMMQREIDWPYSCMMHDFIITENFCIFPCFPVTYNFKRAMETGELFKWEPQLPTVFGIMSRKDKHAKIIWIEFEPCQVMHFSNAFEHNGQIIIDAFKDKESQLFYQSKSGKPLLTNIVRWEIDLNRKAIKETLYEQCRGGFPRFDERLNGRSYRYGYYAQDIGNKKFLNCINRIDFQTGEQHAYQLGQDGVSEPVFIPKNKNAREGEGYLLAMRYCERSNTSCLTLFNAEQINDGPMATIQLPCRVPYTFHGNWVSR